MWRRPKATHCGLRRRQTPPFKPSRQGVVRGHWRCAWDDINRRQALTPLDVSFLIRVWPSGCGRKSQGRKTKPCPTAEPQVEQARSEAKKERAKALREPREARIASRTPTSIRNAIPSRTAITCKRHQSAVPRLRRSRSQRRQTPKPSASKLHLATNSELPTFLAAQVEVMQAVAQRPPRANEVATAGALWQARGRAHGGPKGRPPDRLCVDRSRQDQGCAGTNGPPRTAG